MTIRIKNTADDRTKTRLHRVAPKLIQEPCILGRRLRLGETMFISEESYSSKFLKEYLSSLVKDGVIDIFYERAAISDLEIAVNPELPQNMFENIPKEGPYEILKDSENTSVKLEPISEENISSSKLEDMPLPIGAGLEPKRGPGRRKLS